MITIRYVKLSSLWSLLQSCRYLSFISYLSCFDLFTNHQHSLQNLCEIVVLLTSKLEWPDHVKNNIDNKILIFVKFIPEIYKDLIIILFICLIWFASKSIQVIVNDVETRFSKIQDVSVNQIIQWKRNYFITLDWIEEIDGFFGSLLVIFFAQIFLTTSVFSFRCLNGIFRGKDENPLTSLIKVGINITATSALIIVTQIMKNQVK